MASCGVDRKIRIYDMITKNLKHTIHDNKYSIYTLQYSPNNLFLACCGEDKIVHIYDTKKYEE